MALPQLILRGYSSRASIQVCVVCALCIWVSLSLSSLPSSSPVSSYLRGQAERTAQTRPTWMKPPWLARLQQWTRLQQHQQQQQQQHQHNGFKKEVKLQQPAALHQLAKYHGYKISPPWLTKLKQQTQLQQSTQRQQHTVQNKLAKLQQLADSHQLTASRHHQPQYEQTRPFRPQRQPSFLPQDDPTLPPLGKGPHPLTLISPYVLNSPDVCNGVHPLHVLVVVHTATHHFQRRHDIRQTWARTDLMSTRQLRVIFALGRPSEEHVQEKIAREHESHGDVVQGDFADTYYNLTHKAVLALRWVHQYCRHAQLVLKVDDDVFINPFLFHQLYFPRFSPRKRTVACEAVARSPIHRHGKWAAEETVFPGLSFWPFVFCCGYAVIMTSDLVRPLYHAAFSEPFMKLDDVYVYGMLAQRVGGVSRVSIKATVSREEGAGLQCYRSVRPACPLLAARAGSRAVMRELWALALQQASHSTRQQVNPRYLQPV